MDGRAGTATLDPVPPGTAGNTLDSSMGFLHYPRPPTSHP